MSNSKLDVRQIISRSVLDDMFLTAPQQLDTVLQSLNQDLTVPLRVDATSTPSLTVNVKGSNIYNSSSSRNKSVTYINNTIPSLSSGSVIFPSTSGGNITTSTGGSYVFNISVNTYNKIVLSLDENSNIIVTIGTEHSLPNNVITPNPLPNTLPFALILVQNVSGTIQPIAQNSIYQLVGNRANKALTQEVSLTMGTKSQTVTLPSPQANTNYPILAQIVNIIDPNPMYLPVYVSNRTTTQATFSWNAPLDSNNYNLDYLIPDSVLQFSTIPITAGGTGQTTANNGLNALLPTQTSNAGKYLQTDGTNTSWQSVSALPTQTSNAGKVLTTDGTNASWTNNPTLTNPTWTTQTLVGSTSTLNWDMDLGGGAIVTISTNQTAVNFTNIKPGATYMLQVTQSGSSRLITWSQAGISFKWPGGTPPVLSTTNGAMDFITLYAVNATTFIGSYLYGIA